MILINIFFVFFMLKNVIRDTFYWHQYVFFHTGGYA